MPTTYKILGGQELSSVSLQLEWALVLLLVVTHKDRATVLAKSPLDEAETAQVLNALVSAGHIAVVDSADDRSKTPALFNYDLAAPPDEVLHAVPRLRGDVDVGAISGDMAEYFLLSQIDGSTNVADLQSITSMRPETLIRRLVKHYDLGTIDFPPRFRDRYLTAEARALAAGPPPPTSQDELEEQRTVTSRLASAPRVSGPLLHCTAFVPEGAPSDQPLDVRDEELLGLFVEPTRVADALNQLGGDVWDGVERVLELYRRGQLELEPPGTVSSRRPTPRREPVDKVDAPGQTTDSIWALPKILMRGKEDPDYESRWTDFPHTGELSAVPFESVFEFIHARAFTGVLHTRWGAAQRNVWFLRGSPVHASTTEPEEEVGSLLWRSGRLDRETYLVLERGRLEQPDQEAWELLAGLNAVTPDELQQARRAQLAIIVAKLFALKNGKYLFLGRLRLQSDLSMLEVDVAELRRFVAARLANGRTGSPPPEAEPTVPPVTTAAPASVRRRPTPAPPVQPPRDDALSTRTPPRNPGEWVQANLDRYVVMAPGGPAALSGKRLGEKERRLLQTLYESPRRLRELLPMSSLGRFRTYDFFAALWGAGVLDLADEVEDTDEVLRDQASLDRWLVRLETGDHFEALGCHPTATPGELSEAYGAQSSRFSPDDFGDRPPAFRRTLDRIGKVLDRAYSVLRDPDRRRDYRRQTYGPERLRQFADVQAKKADVFLFFKQDFSQARTLYESAHDLVPTEGTYLALLGYCEVRCAERDAARRQAGERMVRRALATSPAEPRVHLIAALLDRLLGHPASAQKRLDRARGLVENREQLVRLMKSYRIIE